MPSALTSLLSDILLIAGSMFVIVGAVGIVRMPDFYEAACGKRYRDRGLIPPRFGYGAAFWNFFRLHKTYFYRPVYLLR